MAMRDQRARVKEKARAKVQRKLKWKREQEGRPEKASDVSIEEAMRELDNDRFFTSQFETNHISRDAPNEDYALAVAIGRGGPPSTTVFLEGDDYEALADDIRAFHTQQFRKRGNWSLFTTDKTYPYIDVTAGLAGPVASQITWGRIRFGMRHVGDVKLGHGITAPVYAISHLDEMFPTGQNDEDRAVAEEEDARSANDSDSDTEV